MTTLDLGEGAPEALLRHDAVYVLGVGGPEDESGIGDTSSFVWRCAVLRRAGESDVALLFSSMPRLMGFTREVNGAAPFTVPTEALRVSTADIRAVDARAWLDPSPAMLDSAIAEGGTVEERRLPELEGAPS